MSFKDKAKEIIDSVVEKVKDPDGTLVEKTWPAGEAPEGDADPSKAKGIDPDLDPPNPEHTDRG